MYFRIANVLAEFNHLSGVDDEVKQQIVDDTWHQVGCFVSVGHGLSESCTFTHAMISLQRLWTKILNYELFSRLNPLFAI